MRAVTGEKVTTAELGRSEAPARTSGIAALARRDEERRGGEVRYLRSVLPVIGRESAPGVSTADDDPEERRVDALLDLVPAEPNRPDDVRAVLAGLVDGGGCFGVFFEVLHPTGACDAVSAFARPAGRAAARFVAAARRPGGLGALYSVASARLVRYDHPWPYEQP